MAGNVTRLAGTCAGAIAALVVSADTRVTLAPEHANRSQPRAVRAGRAAHTARAAKTARATKTARTPRTGRAAKTAHAAHTVRAAYSAGTANASRAARTRAVQTA